MTILNIVPMKARALAIIGLLAIIYILFATLGRFPMQLWDESRLATSALEMSHSHDLIVTTFDDTPDLWNTKPPLLIWLQALSLSLLGANEFAARLPSAIAALLTLFSLLLFLRKEKATVAGIFSLVILITTAGYTRIHGTFSADYDSLLVLFTTLYCLQFYRYIHDGTNANLFACIVLVIAATLTKGIAGLLFTPALLIYAIYSKRAAAMLRNGYFYAGIALFLTTVGGYYLLREYYNPGYLSAVWENELGGRFLRENEGHAGSMLYYTRLIVFSQYTYWLGFFAAAAGYYLFYPKAAHCKPARYLLLLCATFYFIINISRTKLDWYTMPMFPFLAIITGMFLYELLFQRAGPVFSRPAVRNIVTILLFLFPAYQTFTRATNPGREIIINHDANEVATKLSGYLHSGRAEPLEVAWREYQGALSFYILAFEGEKIPVRRAKVDSLTPGTHILLYEPEVKQEIEDKYTVQVIETGTYTTTLNIVSRK